MNRYTISRAFRNIRRIPGRSILTGSILLVIITMVLVGLTVQAGTKASISQARKAIGNKVILQPNQQGYQSSEGGTQSSVITNTGELTEDEANKLISSKLIENYDYIITAFADSEIDPVTAEPSAFTAGSVNTGNSLQMDFRLTGSSNLELMEDFKGGTKTLAEGRYFTADELKSVEPVVVISKTLAEKNHLEIGSKFNVNLVKSNQKGPTLNVEVIGIFEDTGKETAIGGFPMLLRGNTIHMPYTVLQDNLTKFTEYPKNYISSAYYFLNDPMELDLLKKEAESTGLNLSNFSLDMSDKSFTKITSPMNKLLIFTKTGVITALLAGAFIMILLMTIITRERKTEVGILRALGATRAAVALQFITESLMICAVALLIGIVSGHALSQSAANYLLEKEITQEEQSTANAMVSIDDVLNPNSVETADFQIDTAIGFDQILKLFGAGLFICLCGSFTSIYWIMKYEPMKMLVNRT